MKSTYESGATTHAVNDLILFTDNTRELAEKCARKYEAIRTGKIKNTEAAFTDLFYDAQWQYKKEFPNSADHAHILGIDKAGQTEFCHLYSIEYPIWLKENY